MFRSLWYYWPILALYPNGTCDRDSDCLDPVGYHAVKGPRGVALMSTYVPQPKLVLATSGSGL